MNHQQTTWSGLGQERPVPFPTGSPPCTSYDLGLIVREIEKAHGEWVRTGNPSSLQRKQVGLGIALRCLKQVIDRGTVSPSTKTAIRRIIAERAWGDSALLNLALAVDALPVGQTEHERATTWAKKNLWVLVAAAVLIALIWRRR